MSKTKGNVLDPIEVIGRMGRMRRVYFAAMAAPGTDIAFSESRTAGYRNFANKIWNAARFMFMNVDGWTRPAARRRAGMPAPHEPRSGRVPGCVAGGPVDSLEV